MNFYIIKQVINFIITCYSIYELNNEYIYLPKILLLYFSINVFLQRKKEKVIQYIILLISAYYFNFLQKQNNIEDIKELLDISIKMEFGNIFLYLNNILDNINIDNDIMILIKFQSYKTIFEFVYIMFFIKYRLIENYMFFFKYDFINLYNIYGEETTLIYFILTSFLLVNVHIFITILKQIYEKYCLNLKCNSDIYSEYLQKYISLLFPIHVFTKNMFSYKWYYYFDVLGVLSFSLNNFLFHNNNVRTIMYPNNSLIMEKWIDYYILYIQFFNVKTCLYTITMSIYFNDKLYYIFSITSLFTNYSLLFNYKQIKYDFDNLTIRHYLSMYDNKNEMYYWMNVNYFWFILNIIVTSMFINDIEYTIKNYLLFYVIILIIRIKPFYKQNNTILLFLLALQNILLTNSYR